MGNVFHTYCILCCVSSAKALLSSGIACKRVSFSVIKLTEKLTGTDIQGATLKTTCISYYTQVKHQFRIICTTTWALSSTLASPDVSTLDEGS